MVTLYPVAGAFTHYATRFLDPAFGKRYGRITATVADDASLSRFCTGVELLLLLGDHITW
jgi:hypothetical protein